MATNLLQTKLTMLATRPFLVPRPRLLQKLAGGLGGKLILVSAPAGFGKTTLVAAWQLQGGKAAPLLAWVSLDEHDNDPARFAAYLTTALQPILPKTFEPSPGAALVEVMTEVVNGVTAVLAARADTHALLVLDDYHLITNPAIHEALTFFVEYMPASMHLCLVSRADPPLPLARWRARGQLTELRQQDLRFTPAEAAQFLNEVMGLNVSAADVAALNGRTEGWAAGLQMAALSLQGREDAGAFIHAFTGSNRYILDYLMEEVLQQQPERVQRFLLQTAVLERLTAPLCDALLALENSGSPDTQSPVAQSPSREILAQLEAANLFIVPLDQERQWYRYHRLFADLLRQRLQESRLADIAGLHRRASQWHEANGYPERAIDHALQAGDVERAADLIEKVAEVVLMRSEMGTFKGWVAALPDALVRARPSLCLYDAWIMSMEGRPLAEIEALLRAVTAEEAPGELAAVRSLLALLEGGGARAVELAQSALAQLPDERQFLRGVATWILGMAYLLVGDTAAGTAALETAVRLSRQTGNLTIATVSLNRLANQAWRVGDLHKAARIYQQALALATDEAERPLPIAGETLIGLSRVRYEWNDLEGAYQCAADGIALTERWREMAAMGGYVWLARVEMVRGHTAAAWQAMAQAQTIAWQSKGTEMDDRAVALWSAQLCLLAGDLDGARSWAAVRNLPETIDEAALSRREEIVAGHLWKYEYLVLARLWLAENRGEVALALLRPLLADAQRQRRIDLQIEISILLALAYRLIGQTATAVAHMGRAITLGEPGGFVRVFVDAGPDVAELLAQQKIESGLQKAYVDTLMAALGQAQSPAAPLPVSNLQSTLVEPLSDRELEVLTLIADGLSNREIAQALVLSLPTIKWHTSNIYGKLGVGNRTTAVARARDLRILP